MPVCFICNKTSPTIISLKHHFDIIHSNIKIDRYKCAEHGCNRHFSLLNSFKRHLRLHHAERGTQEDNRFNPVNISEQPLCIIDSNAESIPCSSGSKEIGSIPNQFTPIHRPSSNIGFQDRLAKFCASLYAKPQVPRNVIQFVIDGINSVVIDALKDSSRSLHDTDSQSLHSQSHVTSLVNVIEHSFHSLSSEHKRFAYFENKGTYIPPRQYVIGETLTEVRRNNVLHVEPTVITQQVIDLRCILKKYFELPNVFQETLECIKDIGNSDSVYINFIQGSVWSGKEKHEGTVTLPMFLYFDDFEVGNPLGSHAGIHKLGALYVSIPCLPEWYRSLLSNIFLVLLFHSSDRTIFGNSVVFKPIVDEFNFLRDTGVHIKTDNFEGFVKFELGLIVGDNLGLHSITGFVESFSANYCCRYCSITKEDLKSKCILDQSLYRSQESYLKDIAECSVSKSGIKETCVWSDIKDFNIIEQLGVDVMHDLLEGVCKYDMLFLVSYFTTDVKFFSLETLNERIKNFDYGPDNSSKPVTISPDNLKKQNIRQSASEMCTLVRYFGLLVGDLVPENNSVWNLYLLLKQILDLVLSNSLQKGSCELLEVLISEHHQLYLQYSGKSLTPKFHFLLHYPDMIRRFGPLVAIWSMRYEAKHRISKTAANSTSSRVNICKSVAIKHQLQLNNMFLNKEFGNKLKLSPSTQVQNDSDYLNCSQITSSTIQSIVKVNWVEVKGTKYNVHSIITLDVAEDSNPIFGSVKEIFVVNENVVIFKCIKMKTLWFDVHFGCYEVEYNTKEVSFILVNNLPSHVPNHMNSITCGHRYVTVRGGL